MKIAISGASGFIGMSIKEKWPDKQAEFVALKRDETDEVWTQKIAEADVVINLAGSPVVQRWTVKNMQTILNSRVETTRRIVRIMNNSTYKKQKVFVSASAIGIYPDVGIMAHSEDSTHRGTSFLSEVVIAWEQEAEQLANPKARLVITRIGVVIGNGGGLLKKTKPLFKLGLGGRISSGKQFMSFIHIDDLVNAVHFLVNNAKSKGVYNLVAPKLTTNAEFTKVLSRMIRRPAILPVPAFALRILYGNAADILINGEKVFPQRLLDAGYNFIYPTIRKALANA